MKVKRNQIKNLFLALDRTKYEMPISSIFRHMALKNVNILISEMNKINENFALPPEFNEFATKRDAILTSYNLTTDKSGSSLSQEDKEVLERKLQDLNTEYEDVLNKVLEINNKKEELMKQDVDLPLLQIDIKDMPTIAKETENHWTVWNLLSTFVKDE